MSFLQGINLASSVDDLSDKLGTKIMVSLKNNISVLNSNTY